MWSKIFLFLIIGIFVLIAPGNPQQDEIKNTEKNDITSHPLYQKLFSDGVFEKGVDNTKAFNELLERDRIQPILNSYSGSTVLSEINPGATPQLSESFIFIEDFLEIYLPHGVLVAPDDRIWILPYETTEEIGIDINDDDIPDIWEPCRAIYCYNEDGTQASFSPITVIEYQGRQDTLWGSNRGLSLNSDGSIMVTTFGNFYRLDHVTAECTGWIDLSDIGTPTEAASDMYGNIYVGAVMAGYPIRIYNSDLEYTGNVQDNVTHLSRSLVVTPDGKDVYSGAIYSGTNGVIHYHSDNGPSGPYSEVATLGTDGTYSLWAQCLDWGPDANIWVGTYWDVAPDDPNGWYSMNPANGQMEDSIGVNMRGNVNDFPRPAPASYIYAPRGITWTNDGNYAYTADFRGDVIKKWRYIKKSQIYLPEPFYDFSFVEVDSSKSWIMKIFNRSMDTVTVNDITNSLPQFRIGSTYHVIEPNDSTFIEIEFFPADTLEYIDTLFIFSSDTINPVLSLVLRGMGWYPPNIAVSPDTLYQSLVTGSVAEQNLLIDNSGAGSLDYNISITNTSQNYAIEFDGNDDYIELQNSLPDLTEMTIQAWVYYKGGYSTGTIFMDASTENGNDLLLDMNSSGIGIRADKGQAYLNLEDAQVNSGLDMGYSWHFICWTMTPSLSRIFIDGNLVATIPEPGSNVGYHAENPTIGCWWDGWYAMKFFRGTIDELRIWNVAKSQEEIRAEMYQEVHGSNPALVGYWCFNEGSGSRVFDQSLNGNNGTLMEGANWVVSTNSFAPSWISVNPDQGIVNPGSDQNIKIEFDALGLFGGRTTAELLVLSNDPDEQEITIPVILDVTGAPNIQAESDTIDFGQVFNGVTKILNFTVQNSGTDDLLISSVVAQPDEFTVSPAFAGIDARDIEVFTVEFAPQGTGKINGTLTFNSNDPDENSLVVQLSGEGVEPPVIAIMPDSVTDVLYTNQTAEHTITIDNTQGGSDLVWHIELENVGLGTKTFTKPDYSDWTLHENQDRITGNVWITRANQRGLFNAAVETEHNYGSPNDTEWAYGLTKNLSQEDYTIWRDAVYPPPSMVGQPLSLHLISDDKYFDLMFHHWTEQADGGGFSYTRTDISPRWIELSLESGITPRDSTTDLTVTLNATGLFGGEYKGNIIIKSNDPLTPEYILPLKLSVTGAPDMQIDIVRYDSTSVKNWRTNNAKTTHIFHTSFPARADGILRITLEGAYSENFQYAEVFVESNLLSTINPNVSGSTTRDLFIPLAQLNEYILDGKVNVAVQNSFDVFPEIGDNLHKVQLIYPGSGDTLNFSRTFTGYQSMKNIYIRNTGTDVLVISSATVDNDTFSVSPSSLNINFGSENILNVAFAPAVAHEYSGTLKLETNAPGNATINIPLYGQGIVPPLISVEPDSLRAEVNSGEIKSTTLRIFNDGGSELQFGILAYQSAGATTNYALQFDGIDDVVSTNRLYSNPNVYTLEMWFKSNSTSGGNLISFEDIPAGTSAQSDHIIYMDDSGLINFGVFLYGERAISSPESYNDNQWHHVAATLSQSAGMSLYIDGSLVANDPSTTSGENFPGFWRFGAGTVDYWPNAPSSSFFKGTLDEIRIWNTAHTESKIMENKNTILTGNETGLKTYWRLDELEGNTAIDLSTSKNHGFLNGGINRIISTSPISPNWLKSIPGSGNIAANDSIDIEVIFDATELDGDSYEGTIAIQCNDPNEPQIAIPVFLSVIPSDIGDVLTNEIPKTYMLFQNYPNPFNPATQIRFGLPKPGKVIIELFNILGQKTETILEENMSAGYHQVTFDGGRYASGVYVYRMRTGNFVKSIKMLLIR